MSGAEGVPRPLKRAEFEVCFITASARKGWADCLAGARNAAVDAWDCLTQTPDSQTERQYKLKADLATGTWAGLTFDRWRYKVTDGGRIWYFIEYTPQDRSKAGRVLIERVTMAHPKETERRRGR